MKTTKTICIDVRTFNMLNEEKNASRALEDAYLNTKGVDVIEFRKKKKRVVQESSGDISVSENTTGELQQTE